MQRPICVLLVAGALVRAAGAVWAQSTYDSANPPVSLPPIPGFSSQDPRPGSPGGSPASSGSGVGSNVGAGASASPLGVDPITPGSLAPEAGQPRQTRPLFNLSRDFPTPPAPTR
jgi:hypothetical protein